MSGNMFIENRAKEAGVPSGDLAVALESFLKMLSNEELKLFINDMMNSSCCNKGCGCH